MLAQEKLIEAELSLVFPIGETTGDFRNPPLGYQALGDIADRADKYRWKRIISTTPLTAVREVKIQILWQQGISDEVLEASTYVFASTTGF
jgi:general secretion pathway protein I